MPERKITRTFAESAPLGQIHDAIDLFHVSKFDSAITLSHAAQGMIQKTDKPHFGYKLELLAKVLPETEEGAKAPNDFANWLKHHNPEKRR